MAQLPEKHSGLGKLQSMALALLSAEILTFLKQLLRGCKAVHGREAGFLWGSSAHLFTASPPVGWWLMPECQAALVQNMLKRRDPGLPSSQAQLQWRHSARYAQADENLSKQHQCCLHLVMSSSLQAAQVIRKNVKPTITS